jgi:hypothetical protein
MEFLGQLTFQTNHNLIADLSFFRQQTVGLPEVVFGQALHTYQETALVPRPAGPLFDQTINSLPAPQVEIADTEIRAVGDFQCLPQGGE